MVSRSVTEVLVLMRNNALHARSLHLDQDQHSSSERVRLMRSDTEVEGSGGPGECYPPPPWLDSLEEAQYIMTRLRSKLEELRAMQARHLQRPTLDDAGTEEQHVSRLTGELGKHFGSAHRIVQGIRAQAAQGKPIEQKLAQNVVLALVTSLQEISLAFRTAQSNYLRQLSSREERSNAYFELPNFEELSLNDTELLPGLTSSKETDDIFTFGPSVSALRSDTVFFENEENIDHAFQRPPLNQKQLLAFQEENTKMADERDREVNKIVRSILDLNDIFKDLAHVVQEQGTILDRIDYNIEQTQVQVHEGYKQLRKADGYQRKNRKMHCILVLGVTISIMLVLLIIVKS